MADQVKELGEDHKVQVGKRRLRRTTAAILMVFDHIEDQELVEQDQVTAEVIAYGILRVWDQMNTPQGAD